jgi:N2227-like protein
MTDVGFTRLLQCPRCRTAGLVRAGNGFSCATCAVSFADIGGIPWLFADPVGTLGDWRNRLSLYLDEFLAAERAVDAELLERLRPATRERLGRLRDAYREQRRLVGTLLSPLGLVSLPMPHSTPLAFATRLPANQDLHSYYGNLFRDWCWGDEENSASAAVVQALLAGDEQRILVLGAGGCRLAHDLHAASAHPLTVALDINPLLLLSAAEILSGDTVELYEFPTAPRCAEDVAVRRKLAAAQECRAGLELMFADAWRAPFPPQTFDAVVTPWLVDVVDLDFESIALAVNRLLRPGGRWINFGSLAFPWRRAALRHDAAEIAVILTETGFEVVNQGDTTIPYMRSPASRHSRLETVASFAAVKRRRGPREFVPTPMFPWLADTALPVPRSSALALAADASRIQAVVLALVDGHRSVSDLAQVIAEQGLLPHDQALAAVGGLLERLHVGAARSAGA